MSDISPPRRYHDLEELLQNPALLEPPPLVLPRLAWEGRLTMLAAPEKSGKSTLVGQGVAAMATGQYFLDSVAPAGRVLWLALDEPLGDLVRRLRTYGATGGVSICEERPGSVELMGMIRDTGARLVVIDTLTEFASDFVADGNAALQWQPILKALRSILHDTGAAGILLHHANKSTGRYRDSSQIGAGVDVIIEMTPSEDDPTVRKCRVRGRVKGQDFTLRYIEPHYNIEASGELTLDARIVLAVESRPGLSKRELRQAVPGKASAVDQKIGELMRSGVLVNRGDQRASAFYVENGGTRPGHARDTLTRESVTPIDTTGTRSGHGLGHGSVSHPLKGGVGTRINPGALNGHESWQDPAA